MVTVQTEKKIKSIFNVLPFVGALSVLVAMGLAIYHGQFDPLSYSLLAVGFLLFLTLFVKAEVSNLKYYLHLTFYTVLVTAICVVGYLFANRYTQRLDLSENKLYSLSPATAKYLESLTDEVKVTIFTPTSDPFEMIRRLYAGETDKVKWEFVDAIKEPLKARQSGEDVRNGDVFIVSGDNSKRLTAQELMTADYENVVTNSIVDVTRKDRPKVYFLEGHGEVAFDTPPMDPRARQSGPEPTVRGFRELLGQRGIESAPLDLAKEGAVPADATMLVIAGPQTDLFSPEARAVEAFLDKGGKLLALLDPTTNRTSSGVLPNLESTLERYGLSLPNSIVLDLFSASLGAVVSPEQPLLSAFDPTHPITRDLSKRPTRTVLGMTRPILAHSEGSWQATTLAQSSPQSWAVDVQALISSGGQLSPPAQGSYAAQPLGVAISEATPASLRQMPAPPPENKGGMRLVVFGTSLLIQDDYLYNNQIAIELMLNTINWLSEREDMIAVPSKQVRGTPITLNAAQLRVIFVLSVVMIPALLFFGGVTYSMVRRRT